MLPEGKDAPALLCAPRALAQRREQGREQGSCRVYEKLGDAASQAFLCKLPVRVYWRVPWSGGVHAFPLENVRVKLFF